jgi:hypothetical protein
MISLSLSLIHAGGLAWVNKRHEMRRGGAALSGRNQIAGPNICIGIAPTVQIW